MSYRCRPIQRSIVILAVALVSFTFGSLHASAASAVVGSVAGSVDSTLSGQPVVANSLIFSGDTLRVADGATVVTTGSGSRLAFGRQTEASFLRDDSQLTVLLERGDMSLYRADPSGGLLVKVNDLSITPGKGFTTLGEVATLNGSVVVTVKEGELRVEGNGSPVEVTKGKTVTILPKTQRAPQGTPTSGGNGGSQKLLSLTAIGVGTVGIIVGAIGVSRANSATTTANSAGSAAAAAADAASAAAQAATAATNLATSVLSTSLLASNLVGCDLNAFANAQGKPSPYTPPTGFTCP